MMKLIVGAVVGLFLGAGVAANARETAPEPVPMVRVLKNQDVLPLDKTKIRRIAVIGSPAEYVFSYDESGTLQVSKNSLQRLQERAAPGTEIVYERGCALSHLQANAKHLLLLRGVGFVGTKFGPQEPTFSGSSIKLYADKAGDFIEFAVDVPKSGRYDITLQYDNSSDKNWTSGRGIYQLSIDGVKQGAPFDFYNNTLPRYDLIANFGSKNFTFAGRKKFRFTMVGKNPESDSADGHFDKLMLNGPQKLNFELEHAPRTTRDDDETVSIARAAELARTADVALVFVGSTEFIQRSGPDRGKNKNIFVLTGNQGPLVRAVLAANPRTIVIEISTEPLRVPWFDDNVPAILHCPVRFLSDNGSCVLAAALFGENE